MNNYLRSAFVAFMVPVAIFWVGCAKPKGPSSKNAPAPPSIVEPWYFAASGDSRNCGDVVMPAIAAGATKDSAAFYWHLGDLRRISAPDEDYVQQKTLAGEAVNVDQYHSDAWGDFIQNQANAFSAMPLFLGIGNHETIPPKTRAEFATTFTKFLDMPELRQQRLKDDPHDSAPRTYYHWVRDGIDFINLDNAVNDQFDDTEVKWFESVIARDAADNSILTVVAGMHEALPESISADHSMNKSEEGQRTGQQVYVDLLKLKNESHKQVYVLASHSHYYMDGIFNTEYWRTHGGVLPGWIIGTAGAVRYQLPANYKDANAAKTNVYGYLLATVNPPGSARGSIQFDFKELQPQDIPAATVTRFTSPFVQKCFDGNRQ
jgi:hypothetical protein